MRPLTDTKPKPMVEFHGRPFLEYVVELLREQGFERVLMLLGYLPEVIQEHFGDGSGFGLEVDYSVTGPDDLTVSRVRAAHHLLEGSFLLLYCDNYWPLRMDDHWRHFLRLGAPAMVTVYANRDDYRPGKDSVVVEDGHVRAFDKTKTVEGLRGVEISYAILTAPVLDLLPVRDELLEVALYPELAARGQLGAYVSDHRYYSVGSLERLPATERFLARRPTVILDRDGTLNRRPPPARYVRRPEEFDWLPGSLEALGLLADRGYRVVVVSNQAGIARGALTEADLDAVHRRMLAEARGAIEAVYHCPHGWDDGCECRKPAPGMLFRAQRELELDLTRTPFFGDDERDGQAAAAAGCPFTLVSERRPLLDVVQQLVAAREGVIR
jgi:D-glycero-D-manno-heptose 1,7-bisphosphate phosphatase